MRYIIHNSEMFFFLIKSRFNAFAVHVILVISIRIYKWIFLRYTFLYIMFIISQSTNCGGYTIFDPSVCFLWSAPLLWTVLILCSYEGHTHTLIDVHIFRYLLFRSFLGVMPILKLKLAKLKLTSERLVIVTSLKSLNRL